MHVALHAGTPLPVAKPRADGPLTPTFHLTRVRSRVRVCRVAVAKRITAARRWQTAALDRPRQPRRHDLFPAPQRIGLRLPNALAQMSILTGPAFRLLRKPTAAPAVIAPPPCHKIAVRIAHHSGIDVL